MGHVVSGVVVTALSLAGAGQGWRQPLSSRLAGEVMVTIATL